MGELNGGSHERNSGHIDKRDFDANRPLLVHDANGEEVEDVRIASQRRRHSGEEDGLLLGVVTEIAERDRELMRRELVRIGSFVWGVLTATLAFFIAKLIRRMYSACAGSITGFSIYGPLLLSRLHYSQFRVNAVAVTAELAMYLPVSLLGYLCDRYSPGPVALLSAFFFGPGYLLAALTYRSGPPPDSGGSGWPYWVMILGFLGVGAGTASMYLAAVTTCAKNFGLSKHKGFMLAMPIAAFGLSGMWQSQVGRHLLYERGPNGEKGDVDVFKYFLFLAILLFSVGVVGLFALRIVDEEKLIDEAVEELERSGYLDESSFFRSRDEVEGAYGTFNTNCEDTARCEDAEFSSTALSQEEKEKKTWLLNQETKLFLRDRAMWWLAAGFFLASGPGEAYINNVGTVINTLTPLSHPSNLPPPAGYPSTHVTIIALASTIARLVTGSLSDFFAPTSPSHPQSGYAATEASSITPQPRFTLSRLAFLVPSALLLSLGYLYLATPLPPQHPSTFPIATSLVGFGYGATFSLVPIIISVVWGVENFGTNWGVVAMVPALGATVWGVVYSVGYEAALTPGAGGECHGWRCYGYWALGCMGSVWAAVILWGFAWRGWRKRGVIV
ncbi:Putative monocarboxylate transporter mch1 [Emydomyces testavorans]|uniref:Probable transporter MCH1 n=1 Tax=Emydomyces testavorans TaxID=2070801 RepID=A0AAF0DG00_9EURO|nr:Putative monocarboxylate transporter mch1 [Emydomyces testavorans]